MAHGRKLSCVLCQRTEETKITGNLLTKDEITAHQNCLLFSSNIFCRDSPEYDDLFGFSVEDVLDEVKRGSRLMCNYCKKKGATAGCENKRCKKSYHYPCAVTEGAKPFQDQETYGLYCLKHYLKQQGEQNNSVTGHASSSSTTPQTSRSSSEAGPSKVNCLACEKKEGSVSLESLSNGINMFYCHKHAPSSRQRKTNGADATGARPALYSSDSNSSSSATQSSSKRRRSSGDKQKETPSKRKSVIFNGLITDDSSDSDKNENEPHTEIQMFAPLESDLEESALEQQAVPQSNGKEIPAGSPPGNQREDENNDDDATIIHSDGESESLLSPVRTPVASPPLSKTTVELATQTEAPINPHLITVKAEMESGSVQEEFDPEQSAIHSPGPRVPQQVSSGPPPSPSLLRPRRVTPSGSCSSSPTAHPPNPVLHNNIDSAGFWRSCNAAGCTQAIFADFINMMNSVSSRIQSDQASQDDHDLALSVMEASGKLMEFVSKQQKDLQRKRLEVRKAVAAMDEVVSALRK